MRSGWRVRHLGTWGSPAGVVSSCGDGRPSHRPRGTHACSCCREPPGCAPRAAARARLRELPSEGLLAATWISHPGSERPSSVLCSALCHCRRSARTEGGEEESPPASVTRASGPSGKLLRSSEPRSSFVYNEEVNPCFVVFRYNVGNIVLSTWSQCTFLFFLLPFPHFPCRIHSLEVMENPGVHSVCSGAAFCVCVCVRSVCACVHVRAHACRLF